MKFALIGRGKMGKRWEGVIRKQAEIVAFVDPENLGTHTLEEALSIKEIEAFLIATHHIHLAPITEKALKAGKHVLCEKPGGINSKEIKKNAKLAKKMGLVYKIGYNYRFHDGFIKARKLYGEGKIGDLLFIRAVHGFGGRPGYEKEWRINKEIGGGGHLHDQGVHMIDMALSFMGKIDKFGGLRADTFWGSGTEDNAFVLLKSGNVIASIHSSLTQWKRKHTFELYGTEGYLIVEGLGMRYGKPEKLILGKRTKDSDVTKERVIKCNPIADNSLALELEDFMYLHRHSMIGNAMDSYETLRVVEDVYKNDKI